MQQTTIFDDRDTIERNLLKPNDLKLKNEVWLPSGIYITFGGIQDVRQKLLKVLDPMIVQLSFIPFMLADTKTNIITIINMIDLEEISLHALNLDNNLLNQYAHNKLNLALVIMNYDLEFVQQLIWYSKQDKQVIKSRKKCQQKHIAMSKVKQDTLPNNVSCLK